MELTAIPERGAIAEPATGRERGAFRRLSREVAVDPRLPLAEERGDVRLRSCPAPPVRTRNGNDDALRRIEHDPQRPRLRRATEDVAEPAAREIDRCELLRDDPA